MQGNIFTAGVAPGAPTNDFEIKFLICHLLEQAGEPVTFGQLATTFQKTGYVNYFEFSSLMSEMLEQGHLRMLGEGGMAYELTEHGRSTVSYTHLRRGEAPFPGPPPLLREDGILMAKK